MIRLTLNILSMFLAVENHAIHEKFQLVSIWEVLFKRLYFQNSLRCAWPIIRYYILWWTELSSADPWLAERPLISLTYSVYGRLLLGLVPLHGSWVIAVCVDVICAVAVQVRAMDDSSALLPLPNANPVFIRRCKQLGVIRSGESSYSWEISVVYTAGVKLSWQHTWGCNYPFTLIPEEFFFIKVKIRIWKAKSGSRLKRRLRHTVCHYKHVYQRQTI